MEFILTDLMTNILVRYQGSLPDLFKKGHSVVVEGFVKLITEEIKNATTEKSVILSEKARCGDIGMFWPSTMRSTCLRSLEITIAIEKNKKMIEE
ncbi:hypothetical protein ACOSQ2_001570 [Xanthoceras sorbifolium]